MVLRYPGSKSRKLRLLSPYLNWLVGGESACADVCVGGGSVLIHIAGHNPHLQLFANDIDPLIVAFWRACVDGDLVGPFCDKLKDVPNHKTRERLLADLPRDPVELAWAAVVLTRTSYSGILQPTMFQGGRDCSRVKQIDNRYNPQHLAQEVRRYHTLLASRTTVTQMDARRFAQAHRTVPMFIDLPYYQIGAELYRHAPTAAEHAAIAATVRALDRDCASVVASAQSLLAEANRSQRSQVRSRLNVLRVELEGLQTGSLPKTELLPLAA